MSALEVKVGETVMSRCPNCESQAERSAYDIGSGPELSCASCEWCWGANGQDLNPLDPSKVLAEARAAAAEHQRRNAEER